MSINRVMISGNLTREPELRQTANGTAILSLGVAVNDRRQNGDGDWEDYANFVDCTVVGSRAQGLSNHLHKGMKVAIEGKLRYRSWKAKDGGNRSKLEVTVVEIEFMSPKQQQTAQYVQAETYDAPQQGGYYDEQIPF